MSKEPQSDYQSILSIPDTDNRRFIEIVTAKLEQVLPNDIIELGVESTEIEGLTVIDVNGFLFSSDGDEKTQHTIASILVAEEFNDTIFDAAFQNALTINQPGGKSSFPSAVGSDIGGVSVYLLARNSTMSIETLGARVRALQTEHASAFWPDGVGVSNKGLISFSVSIPGRSETGMFFLPRGNARDHSKGSPSITVNLAVIASHNGAFAKLMSFVVARCGITLRSNKVPNYELLAPNFPKHGLSYATYQFDLSGALKPQIFDQAFSSLLPSNRILIVSGEETLGTIKFHPWQDGAVITLGGEFPFEPFLVFLKEIVPELTPQQLQFFREGSNQVSYVLPITQAHFFQALEMFDQRSSNMTVRPDDEVHLIEKAADEGLSSDFVSRLRYGVLTLRSAISFEEGGLDRFDRQYTDVFDRLENVREARRELIEVWSSHKHRVETGENISRRGNLLHVNENVDRAIRRHIDDLWGSATRLIKHASQVFLRGHGIETDFLFKKESTFQSRLEAFRNVDPNLATYLERTRAWSQPLVLLRNDHLEHGPPLDLKVKYDLTKDPPEVIEPTITDMPITDYANHIFDRCACYVEDMTAYCIKQNLPASLTIAEVAPENRDKSVSTRFVLTVSPGGEPEWVIAYSEKTFSDR